MSYKRKYRKGPLITTVGELADQEYVYCNDKITHRGWFLSWQISYAKRMIDRKAIHRAEQIEERIKQHE